MATITRTMAKSFVLGPALPSTSTVLKSVTTDKPPRIAEGMMAKGERSNSKSSGSVQSVRRFQYRPGDPNPASKTNKIKTSRKYKIAYRSGKKVKFKGKYFLFLVVKCMYKKHYYHS